MARRGGDLRYNSPIGAIELRGDRVSIETPRGRDESDAVLCTLPTQRQLPEWHRSAAIS